MKKPQNPKWPVTAGYCCKLLFFFLTQQTWETRIKRALFWHNVFYLALCSITPADDFSCISVSKYNWVDGCKKPMKQVFFFPFTSTFALLLVFLSFLTVKIISKFSGSQWSPQLSLFLGVLILFSLHKKLCIAITEKTLLWL